MKRKAVLQRAVRNVDFDAASSFAVLGRAAGKTITAAVAREYSKGKISEEM
jgi:hypothetical protein